MTTLASDAQALLPTLCRAFSQATGWTLHYTPIAVDHPEVEARFSSDPHCCWFAEIHDGRDPVGVLHVSPPDYEDSPCSFVQATDLADALADLLGKLASTTRRLELHRNDVSTLVHLGLAVPAQENLAWALTQVLKAAVQLTNARSAAFFLLNSETSRLKLRAVYQIGPEHVPYTERDLEESPCDLQALCDGPTLLSTLDEVDHPFLPESFRAGLCTAVQSETMPIGTLWVYDRRARDFSDRDRHVLQSIAMQIAAVLERVALLRRSETHERISRELRNASESQPGQAPHEQLPADPRFEVAAFCASCYELGGDLCELIPVAPDLLAIAIGDACGNSIPAAMIMSAVRGALRTYPGSDTEVPQVMARVNNALYAITRSHKFMSLCYGVYDAARRRLIYSNAGHPQPLLVRRGEVHVLNSHGLLLGVMRDVAYEVDTVQLEPGDLLVCFTDGISEARNRKEQMFRSEGIAEAVLHCARGSAEDVLHAVWKRVETHIAGGEPADDRTLLVLRVR